jgi:TonB family protein
MNSALIKVLCLTSTIVLSSISSTQAQPTNPSKITTPDNPSRLEQSQCLQCNIKYPDSLRKKHIEGRVKVAIDVDKDGNVINVYLVQSSGNPELDEATIMQARNWKLKPSVTERKNVQVQTNYVIRRSLGERLREGRKY